MLRVAVTALRGIAARTVITTSTTIVAGRVVSRCNPVVDYTRCRGFGALSTIANKWSTSEPTQRRTPLNCAVTKHLLAVASQPIDVPVRTQTKASLSKGKRATVRTVLRRFYRLNWGIWIRTRAGRFKHLWKKSFKRKKRLRQHVFCNATQSQMLDKMVSKYWRRRHYYIDDPYAPYHEREEFWITRRKPRP